MLFIMEIAILPVGEHQKAAGERLRHLIDLIGMSYVEAAGVMGVSKHVLRNWMAGDSYPQPYALYRLSRSKGINFDYVFLGDWSNLPHRIARALEEEFGAIPEARSEPVQPDDVSSSAHATVRDSARRGRDRDRNATRRVRAVQ